MDGEAMMRAGRARQSGRACPKGGGYANGGRVAKAAYGGGGSVAAGERPGAAPAGHAKGGRVKGKGC